MDQLRSKIYSDMSSMRHRRKISHTQNHSPGKKLASLSHCCRNGLNGPHMVVSWHWETTRQTILIMVNWDVASRLHIQKDRKKTYWLQYWSSTASFHCSQHWPADGERNPMWGPQWHPHVQALWNRMRTRADLCLARTNECCHQMPQTQMHLYRWAESKWDTRWNWQRGHKIPASFPLM